MTHVALPEGCAHIEWQWEIPPADAADPDGGDRGALLTQFATWTCPPGGEPEELAVRRREINAQGLAFMAEPHLCQHDRETGRELWAAPLAPLPDLT